MVQNREASQLALPALLYINGMISAAVIVGEISAIASEVTSVKLRHPFLRDPVDSAFIDRLPPNSVHQAADEAIHRLPANGVKITCEATMQGGCLLGNSATCEASSSKINKAAHRLATR